MGCYQANQAWVYSKLAQGDEETLRCTESQTNEGAQHVWYSTWSTGLKL